MGNLLADNTLACLWRLGIRMGGPVAVCSGSHWKQFALVASNAEANSVQLRENDHREKDDAQRSPTHRHPASTYRRTDSKIVSRWFYSIRIAFVDGMVEQHTESTANVAAQAHGDINGKYWNSFSGWMVQGGAWSEERQGESERVGQGIGGIVRWCRAVGESGIRLYSLYAM